MPTLELRPALRMLRSLCAAGALVALACGPGRPLLAAPIVPTSDDQVIERLAALPRVSASRDPATAVREAGALLDAARRDGDPRLAGRALARLNAWQGQADAPAEVVLMQANITQYLHHFDQAIDQLGALLRRDPGQPQAWLMLATLQRGQGRYEASDRACQGLQSLRVSLHARACLAENLALRGQLVPARSMLLALIAESAQPTTQAWLYTTLAELEQRAGRGPAAEAAWQRALQVAADGYSRLAYADFLLDERRPLEAWKLLQTEVRSDAVLLRLAIAARRAQRPEAAALQAELRERFAQADQRPEDSGHHRERALMALDVDERPALALAAARRNVAQQREPLDLWLLARCAIAAGDAAARAEALALARSMGYHDVRLAAL